MERIESMRNVLVTGGSRGIGKAIVERFINAGYLVSAPSRAELDLSDDISIQRYIEENKNVDFDVIINNAGINDINWIEDITDDEIGTMIQINLIAPIKIIRGFAKNMKEKQYGRIINIGSIWAIVSKEGRTVYSATKHGIHGVTNTVALELAKHNIMVNTVCPGYTLTELTRKNNDEKAINSIAETIPIGRMAEPEEIAEVVFFLADERNTYLTGQRIVVDGGYTVK